MIDRVAAENELILALDRLKRAAPENYAAAEKAVAAYSEAKLRECLTQAEIAQLPRAQGQAQMADWFSQTFSGVTDRAQKISNKSKS